MTVLLAFSNFGSTQRGCLTSKVVRLSALHTGRLYLQGNIPATHFCYRLSQPQGHSAAGRIMSMKNSSDTIGNRTRELPTFSAVLQPLRHRATSIKCNVKIDAEDKTKELINYEP
jgi:hypothetical protein